MAANRQQEAEVETEEDEVTRPSNLGFPSAEVEVQPIRQRPMAADEDGFVQVRMAETIEEFTYVNPHVHYNLEAGKIYRMPAHIARYLDSLGKIYHTM